MPAGPMTAPPSDMDDPAFVRDAASGAERHSATPDGAAGTSGRTGVTGTAALARAYGPSGWPAPGPAGERRGAESASGSTSDAGFALSRSFGQRGTSPDC